MKLKEVQDKSFELLCLIDDICREEKVPYWLDGGSEIASVREKDLIPWDDDVDIKLRLEDYPAFKAAMEKRLPPHLHVLEPDEFAPGFYDFLVRIIDDRYLLRKETEEDRYYGNRQNHLGVDVFIQHYMPEGKIAYLMTYLRLKILYGMGMGHRYRLDYSKFSAMEKIVVAVTSTIGKLVPAGPLVRHYYRVINRLNRKPSARGLRTTVRWDGQVDMSWLGRGTTYGELRGRKFPIPAGYHEELTYNFQDYMSPPPDRFFYEQHLDKEDQYQGE